MAADGASKGDPSKGDLDKLRGTWLTVSLVNDGKTLVDAKAPPNEGPATKLVYDGNTWMIKVGDKTVASGAFKIDPTKMPREIDIRVARTRITIPPGSQSLRRFAAHCMLGLSHCRRTACLSALSSVPRSRPDAVTLLDLRRSSMGRWNE